MHTATWPRPVMSQPFYTPPATKEKKDERVLVMATSSMAVALDKEAAANGETRSDVVRRALDAYYNPQPLRVSDSSELEGGPLLDVRVACGPAAEAREDATIYTVSRRVADEVRFDKDTDYFVRARGESMERRGVLDEFVVVMSPLKVGGKPRKGQIALVRFLDDQGNATGTLKTWDGETSEGPRLLDGEGEVYAFPSGTVSAEPIAIAKGVIGEL